MSDAYGRTGSVQARQIKLAVVTTFPSAADNETLARQRLLAVLAATADDEGLTHVTEQEAFSLAGVPENRDSRKAWQHVVNVAGRKSGSGLDLYPKGNTLDDRPWPFVLTTDDGKVVLAPTLPVTLDADHLDDVDAWVTATCDDLLERGLPNWQHASAIAELSRLAATTLAAVEPESLGEAAAKVDTALTRLTAEVEQMRKKAQQVERRKASAAEAEEALRREIATLEAEIDALGDQDEKVAEAVRLAHEVLAAAALLEDSA